MLLRPLYPEAVDAVEVAAAASGLRLGELAPPERPYLVLNMISSADGRATFDGKAGELGSEADRELFHALRTQADAILVGCGTLRVERYGRLVKDPDRRARRVAEGLAADPVGVILTRTLDVPWDIPLFADPDSAVVVYTTAAGDAPPTAAKVIVEHVEAGELGPEAVLKRLRADHGVRSVLCEGGPTLNAALFAAGVVDELFLTLAPMITGGADPFTIVEGAVPVAPVTLELASALEHESSLFLRYRVTR